jgi:hypothetical protein
MARKQNGKHINIDEVERSSTFTKATEETQSNLI